MLIGVKTSIALIKFVSSNQKEEKYTCWVLEISFVLSTYKQTSDRFTEPKHVHWHEYHAM